MKAKDKLYTAWCMMLIILLIFHFSMTLIYNTPENPISYKYDHLVQRYMTPLFQQNWRLFAPNPVSANNHLWVRGYNKSPNGEEHYTEWVNVSTPLIEEFQRNRFTPLRLAVAQTTGAVVETLNKHSDDQESYEQEIQSAVDGRGDYPLEIVFLKNISSMVLHKKYDRHFDQVHIRIYIDEFPNYYDYITGDRSNSKTMLDLPQLPYSRVTEL